MMPHTAERLKTLLNRYDEISSTSEFQNSHLSPHANEYHTRFEQAVEDVIEPAMQDVARHLRLHTHQCSILRHPTRITMLISPKATEGQAALWCFLIPQFGEVVFHFEGGQLDAGQGGAASLWVDAVTPGEVESRIVTALAPILLPRDTN
jgi:hypothetical protein